MRNRIKMAVLCAVCFQVSLHAGFEQSGFASYLARCHKAYLLVRQFTIDREELSVKEVTKLVKYAFNAYEPNKQINSMAQELIKTTAIPRNIIVLQSNSESSSAASFPFNKQEYVVVGTAGGNLLKKNHKDLLAFSVAHELGHIHNGDILPIGHKKRALVCASDMVAQVVTVPSAIAFFRKYISKKFIWLPFVGGSTFYAPIAARFGERVETAYVLRQEKRADDFGYELLLKKGDVGAVFNNIFFYFIFAEVDPSDKYDHPKHIDRAKAGLRKLQEHGVDIWDEKSLPQVMQQSAVKTIYFKQLNKLPEFSKKKGIDKV